MTDLREPALREIVATVKARWGYDAKYIREGFTSMWEDMTLEALRALADKGDARVTELLEANNAEVERRRKAENELAVFREVAKTALCVSSTLAANPRFFVHLPINMMRDVEIVRDGCRNALGIDRP